METPRRLDVFESGNVSGANFFRDEFSKGIGHEKKFMTIMMSIVLW